MSLMGPASHLFMEAVKEMAITTRARRSVLTNVLVSPVRLELGELDSSLLRSALPLSAVSSLRTWDGVRIKSRSRPSVLLPVATLVSLQAPYP